MRGKTILTALVCMALCSCSTDEPGDGDHVWKDQVDTIERAKQAEQKMLDAVELQRKAIEEQTGSQ